MNSQARAHLPVETPDGVVPTAAAARAYLFDLFVPGTPQPAGSKKAIPAWNRALNGGRGGYAHTADGRPIVSVKDDAKHSRAWKDRITTLAVDAWRGRDLLACPLWLGVELVMPRPRSHYRSGKHADELKPNAPRYHTSAPDSTKCTRAVEDALNGVVWTDDRLVAEQHVTKEYGDHPGARIRVAPLP